MLWNNPVLNPNPTRAPTRMVKYQIWTYDVWGNERDGFDVNDRFRQGTIEIPAKLERYNVGTPNEFASYNVTNDAVIEALKREGYIKRNIRKSSVEIEGEDEYTIYIRHRQTGRPELELENLEPEKMRP